MAGSHSAHQPAGAAERPLIFISCGQCNEDEIALGKSIQRLIQETTTYEAYFAEQQNTLDGLTTNILSSLHRCTGFVAVAHHRGAVRRLNDEIVRASVWVEQEIAIAAFIQHALKRRIEVALYLQKGIQREGIREQLRLAPIEFETADDVVRDFSQRVLSWGLELAPALSLVAEYRFETEHRTRTHHDYILFVDLVNNGSVLVDDWRIRLEIPKEFVELGQGLSDVVRLEEDSASFPAAEAKIYPGDRKPSVLILRYSINERGYELIGAKAPTMKISVWSGNQPPRIQIVPMSELNEF